MASLNPKALAELLRRLDAPPAELATLGAVIHRSANRGLVRIVDGGGGAAYLKWMNRRPLRTKLRLLVRQGAFVSLLAHEYAMLMAARARGVRAAEPLRLIEERGGRSLLLMNELPGVSLRDLAAGPLGCDDARIAAIAAAVGRGAAALHDAGFAFQDLKADHVHIAGDADGVSVGFVDLATAEIWRRVSESERAANLGLLGATLPRAAVSDAVRTAALDAYLGAVREPPARAAFLAAVDAHTRRLWEDRRFRAFYRPSVVVPPRWTPLPGVFGQFDATAVDPSAASEAVEALTRALASGASRATVAGREWSVRMGPARALLWERRHADQLRLFAIDGPRAVAILLDGPRSALLYEPAPAATPLPPSVASLRTLAVAGLKPYGAAVGFGERDTPAGPRLVVTDARALVLPNRMPLA